MLCNAIYFWYSVCWRTWTYTVHTMYCNIFVFFFFLHGPAQANMLTCQVKLLFTHYYGKPRMPAGKQFVCFNLFPPLFRSLFFGCFFFTFRVILLDVTKPCMIAECLFTSTHMVRARDALLSFISLRCSRFYDISHCHV